MVRIWCMRYEAKHSYFKRLAVSSGNFINLPYTLAKRNQEGLCYRINTPEGSHSTFLQKGNEIGPGMKKSISHFPIENHKASTAENYKGNNWSKKYKRCLIISKEKPQKLFALSIPCLMTGTLYRTVPPNNPCMLCGLD